MTWFIAIALLLPLQQFEVAVIRPTAAAATAGTNFNVYEGGRLKITNEPVKLLIRAAFMLQNSQIVGGPSWLEGERYDIEAKTGLPAKPEPGQLQPYLQGLLTERFHFKFHRETREMTVYALVVDKAPKFKPKAEGESTAMNTSNGKGQARLSGTGVSMDALAKYIGNRLGRIVLDNTGLREGYDFTLEWAPDPSPESAVPSLVAALREQLGLTLKSQKSPVEVLVIDSIDKPTDN